MDNWGISLSPFFSLAASSAYFSSSPSPTLVLMSDYVLLCHILVSQSPCRTLAWLMGTNWYHSWNGQLDWSCTSFPVGFSVWYVCVCVCVCVRERETAECICVWILFRVFLCCVSVLSVSGSAILCWADNAVLSRNNKTANTLSVQNLWYFLCPDFYLFTQNWWSCRGVSSAENAVVFLTF